MNITVYLGANEGNDPALRKAVEELGAWVGTSGNALIYGGSKSGLMGALADSVLSAGGKVTGVEPQFFIENEFQHKGLTKLIITKDMSERKNEMINLGDAFIAFPGGTGTLEEITEVMSKVSLKHLNAPCILYNLDGYYNDLKALLKHMIEKGLSSDARLKASSLKGAVTWMPLYLSSKVLSDIYQKARNFNVISFVLLLCRVLLPRTSTNKNRKAFYILSILLISCKNCLYTDYFCRILLSAAVMPQSKHKSRSPS